MPIADAVSLLEPYDLLLVVLGVALLASAALPTYLARRPVTVPMLLVATGAIGVALPLGIPVPDPVANDELTRRLTETCVIISLTGAGLSIDRPFGRRSWAPTWRLLGITMPLTIAVSAVCGWWLGLAPATALLLAAALSPTDPVLASEVSVGPPQKGAVDDESSEQARQDGVPPEAQEDDLRFSLTAEAGLNDGLAFPYVGMAIAMALTGAGPALWFGTWLAVDVALKLLVGLAMGLAGGRALGHLILRMPGHTQSARSMTGLTGLAVTFAVYGATQALGGYGFLAVFVAAVVIRNIERRHDYHEAIHAFVEKAERLVTAVLLLAFGGALVGGLLAPLTWPLAALGTLVVFGLRPLMGWVGMLGFTRASRRDRLAIAFFGIRGVGSFYYLSYALASADFPQAEQAWAVAGFVVLLSIVVHGMAASPALGWLDQRRAEEQEAPAVLAG